MNVNDVTLVIISITIVLVIRFLKRVGVRKSIVLAASLSIVIFGPFVQSLIVNNGGKFVDAKIILTTPNWGKDPIHSKNNQFLFIEDYVNELVANDTTHIKTSMNYVVASLEKGYKSYESYDSNGYTAILVVDQQSKLYNQIILQPTYSAEHIDDDVTKIFCNNKGTDFDLDKQPYLYPTIAVAFVSILVLLFFSGMLGKTHCQEFFDEWPW